MADWIRIADKEELKTALRVECGGRDIAVFRLGEEAFALDDICSHEFSRLSEGEVWDGRVYCPKHGSSFDIRTGQVAGLPATQPVESIPAKIEKGGVYVYTEEW